MDQFTAATTLQPDYSDAWREKGMQEGRLKRPVEAEASLQRAIDLNPSDFDALASFGGILSKAGWVDEASVLYNKSVDVSGGHARSGCGRWGIGSPVASSRNQSCREALHLVFDNMINGALYPTDLV